MGAYLYFRTESNVDEVVKYLFEENQLNMKLREFEEQCIWMVDNKHLDWVKKERKNMLEWETAKFGKGDIKTSTYQSEKFEKAGYSYEDLTEMWTMIFEELNKRFEMKYFANSCALNPDSAYFTLEQIKRITDNGKLISGKTAKSASTRALYAKYKDIFSESEKKEFDISILKKDDKVLIDGIWYRLKYDNNEELRTEWNPRGLPHSLESVEDLASLIEDYEKYIPKIRYDGAIADVEAYIIDDQALVYLETIGTENMVKAITSVLMQGRMKMNDHTIEASFGYFAINKAGNKRKMISLNDGLVHSILYHSPSIIDANFSVLVGRNDKDLENQFYIWMENTNFLPYPKHLIREIYKEIENQNLLKDLVSYGVKAIKIDSSLLEDEALILQNIIINVCKTNGLIDKNAKLLKQKAPLPESKYLTEKQVQKIMDTLDCMPKTYELEDIDIKPIGLKLFSPNFTLYITEADKGSKYDEFESMHTRCLGYVKNESDDLCSEWGYIDVPNYLKLVYPNGGGFEQDLYFEDMYIDSDGNIGSLEELKGTA